MFKSSLSSSAADVRTLIGHSGPVYSTSFNPDNTLLISGSEDGTGQFLEMKERTKMLLFFCIVRLWSLQTFTALVCYKGHNNPVWSVEFRYRRRYHGYWVYSCCFPHSPMGFYFISGSHDRTTRLWSTDHVQPLRIFAGHCSDIDVSQWEREIDEFVELIWGPI